MRKLILEEKPVNQQRRDSDQDAVMRWWKRWNPYWHVGSGIIIALVTGAFYVTSAMDRYDGNIRDVEQLSEGQKKQWQAISQVQQDVSYMKGILERIDKNTEKK